MSLDIFDILRSSGNKFRATGPGSQSISAICPALLAPDMRRSGLATELESVSGGCWSEKVEAETKAPNDSFRAGHTRPSCLRRQSFECLHDERDGSIGKANITARMPARGVRATDWGGTPVSAPEASLFSSSNSTSHAWPGQAFPVISGEIAAADSCTDNAQNADQTRLGESAGRECATHRMLSPEHRFHVRGQPIKAESGGWEEEAYGREVDNDLDRHRDKLRLPHALPNASSDAISATASSAVLSPALMPKLVCEGTKANSDFNCGSPGSVSAYSVEADEMIEMHTGAWKHLFRGAWRKARSKHGSKG
jgi:hypothetical protein